MCFAEVLGLIFGVRALVQGRFSLNTWETHITGALNTVVALMLLSMPLVGVAAVVLYVITREPLYYGITCCWDFLICGLALVITASFADTEHGHLKNEIARRREQKKNQPRPRKNRTGKRRFEDFVEDEGGEPRRRRSRDDDED
ncbi:hypothetical protein [Zavarzinella formosa]|uniref:hypothetical protein n=1 Tax=Zavarzinella formosa TaxID=360055 RepID=UPI0002EFBB65|nr:hypothetical protein [Zavarzinella formosa]